MTCKLENINGEVFYYKEPIYTISHGIYGYLVVSMFSVFFIWSDDSGIHSDDVSEKYTVKYTK
jgi:hypothetical protein